MTSEQLNFLGSDPGAVKHGNFINYYTFHSAKQRVDNLDPQMFPKDIISPIVCLDVGCNTGELTKEILTYIKNLYPNKECYILAVDIDPLLIKRATATNEPNLTFKAMDIMTEGKQQDIKEFLRIHSKSKFDMTFCFSVTMWIHINNGDKGLEEFINFIKKTSNTIIIEPQPWHCYRNAQRRLKKSGNDFPLYHTLKLRSNVDEYIENSINDSTHRKTFESPASSWQRKIQSYTIIIAD